MATPAAMCQAPRTPHAVLARQVQASIMQSKQAEGTTCASGGRGDRPTSVSPACTIDKSCTPRRANKNQCTWTCSPRRGASPSLGNCTSSGKQPPRTERATPCYPDVGPARKPIHVRTMSRHKRWTDPTHVPHQPGDSWMRLPRHLWLVPSLIFLRARYPHPHTKPQPQSHYMPDLATPREGPPERRVRNLRSIEQ